MKQRIGRTQSASAQLQSGASAVEFLIAAPVLFLVGLGTLQAGILYHNKSIINYATFEAARVGATRHAMPDPMMDELGLRVQGELQIHAANGLRKSPWQCERQAY